mgnify:CR=1 FL=1
MYKRQVEEPLGKAISEDLGPAVGRVRFGDEALDASECGVCLLYTSDAADDLLCVDLGGRRIIKKKTHDSPQSNYTPSQTTEHTHTVNTIIHQITELSIHTCNSL